MLSLSLGGIHFHWHSAKAEKVEKKVEMMTDPPTAEKPKRKVMKMELPIIIEPHIVNDGTRRKPTEAEAMQMVEDVQSDRISDAELNSWVWKWVIENERPVMKVYWDRHI